MVSMSYRDPVTGELKPIPLGGLPGIEVGDTPPTDENIEFYIDPDGTPVPPTLDELDGRFVNADGDTMTGPLILQQPGSSGSVETQGVYPTFAANSTGNASGFFRLLRGGLSRWGITVAIYTESGGNAGSNLSIRRYSDDGSDLGEALGINRATGQVNIPNLASPMSVFGVQYLQATIPSGIGLETQLSTNAGGYQGYGGGVSGSNSRITVPVAGLYMVGIAGGFSTNGTGTVRLLGIKYNNASSNPGANGTIPSSVTPPTANSSGWGGSSAASSIVKMAAGDFITAMARQDSGADLVCTATLYAYKIADVP
jgi:hypothetical protein